MAGKGWFASGLLEGYSSHMRWFRKKPEASQELLERFEKIALEFTQSVRALSDPTATNERLSALEATLERRLGEAASELIEAKEKYRQARNAEERHRHSRKKGAAPTSSPEISEEELEALTAELRRELMAAEVPGQHGGGSTHRGMQPVSETLDELIYGDEYDEW